MMSVNKTSAELGNNAVGKHVGWVAQRLLDAVLEPSTGSGPNRQWPSMLHRQAGLLGSKQ
jgi:hypothetical protein